MLTAIKLFNPELAHNTSEKEEANNLDAIKAYDQLIRDNIPVDEKGWEGFLICLLCNFHISVD